MKVILTTPVLLLALWIATPVIAEEGHAKVGVGLYSLSTTVVGGAKSERYAGTALVAGYSFNDLFAINAHYYALQHDLFNAVKMDGFDVALRVGNHGKGFTYFAGLGYYQETLSTQTQEITGGLFGFGLGYNWHHLSLELEGAVRGTDDYAKFSNLNSTEVAAANYSLNLSYRF